MSLCSMTQATWRAKRCFRPPPQLLHCYGRRVWRETVGRQMSMPGHRAAKTRRTWETEPRHDSVRLPLQPQLDTRRTSCPTPPPLNHRLSRRGPSDEPNTIPCGLHQPVSPTPGGKHSRATSQPASAKHTASTNARRMPSVRQVRAVKLSQAVSLVEAASTIEP